MTRASLSAVFKTKTTTGALFLALLVIFGIVFAACGSSTSKTATKSVLTIVPSPVGDYTQAFSPFALPSATVGTQGMVYETLLMYNQINGQIKPWLASSYTFSSDAKTLTFTIRQGVKWSDGQAFSANDVAFTFNLLKQYPAADTNSLWSYLQSVTAPSATTVVLTLKQSYSPLLWYAGGQTYIVPQHLWASVGDPTKYTNTNPIGTGPYLLDKFTPQQVSYKKNPSYWQPGKPQVDELNYPAYDGNQSVELDLDRGNLDWVGLFTPKIGQTFVARNPTKNHYWFTSANVVMLYMNLDKFPFNQLPIRQAISDALDHEQMSQVGESGYEAVASPTGLILPGQQSWLDQTYSNLTPTSVNTSQANQLMQTAMQAAGYTKGSDGIYAKAGKKLSFNLNVVTGWTDWVSDCQIIQNNLKAIGIGVNVNAMSQNSYQTAEQSGNYDMSISWSANGPTPFYFYNGLLSSKNTAPIGQTASTNWERWSDATTDQLLNQYATTTDPTSQQQAIAGLEKIMVNDVPSIPLLYGAFWYEYSTARFTGWPDASNAYAAPSPYTAPENEYVVEQLKPVS